MWGEKPNAPPICYSIACVGRSPLGAERRQALYSSGMRGVSGVWGAWEKNPMRYARWMRGRCVAEVQRLSVLGAIQEIFEQLRRMLRDIGSEGIVGQPVAVDQGDQPILAQLHHVMLGRGFR